MREKMSPDLRRELTWNKVARVHLAATTYLKSRSQHKKKLLMGNWKSICRAYLKYALTIEEIELLPVTDCPPAALPMRKRKLAQLAACENRSGEKAA